MMVNFYWEGIQVKLQESGQMYLKEILLLNYETGFVRAIDIAHRMNFSKPSVSRAMGILKREGYITVKESGQIILTEEGNKLATDIYEKYCLLKLFLTNSLGIGEELAHKEACKMEHIVSDETVDKIERYLQKHNVVIDTALR